VTLEEGWYLMNVSELEQELAHARDPSKPPSTVRRITQAEALEFRSAGNVPDENGRSLRLVLHVRSAEDVRNLSRRRLRFEPDFHDEPTWRREGSVPVNVVPLRLGPIEPAAERGWWHEPEVAELEEEWRKTGRIGDVRVPEAYRSFVYKTVLSLRAAGRSVTVETIASSVARWLSPEDAAAIRSALEEANA
jgi:hypothetical protein